MHFATILSVRRGLLADNHGSFHVSCFTQNLEVYDKFVRALQRILDGPIRVGQVCLVGWTGRY